jgi:hypothetical protein
MWKIFSFELRYRSGTLLHILVTSLLFFWLLSSNWLLTGEVKSRINSGNLFFVFMLICMGIHLIINTWSREYRNRRVLPLPVSLPSVALARLSVQLFIWAFLLAIYISFGLISPLFRLEGNTLTLMVGQTGTVLVAVALIQFWRDLVLPIKNSSVKGLIPKNISRLLSFFIPLVLNLMAMIQVILIFYCTAKSQNLLTRVWLNPAVAWSVTLLGIALCGFSLLAFAKKRSYLN